MAPFRLIFSQDRSHQLQEASGMLPGAPGAQGGPKNCGPPPQKIMKRGLTAVLLVLSTAVRCSAALKGTLHWPDLSFSC